MADNEYFAFLSYSHRDSAWARWLHRSLESYRLPSGLVRDDGSLPKRRVSPVFRDRDELSAAADLTASIHMALRRSRFLVVLCSPAAAASPYVNAEIRAFRDLDGEGRVFAVIVEGEPPTCFPPALLVGNSEPIAADARTIGDGKTDAKLKLIAGMLGVGFDSLKRRELRRQRNRLIILSSVVGAVALAMGAFAWEATRARAVAEERERDAIEARRTAEAAELRARDTLARSRFIEAADKLTAGDSGSALAVLARAVSDDPGARLARIRLHSLLNNQNHAVPVAAFQTKETVHAHSPWFHPDGGHFFDGERIWDLATRDLVTQGPDFSWVPTRLVSLADPERPLIRIANLTNVARIVAFNAVHETVTDLKHTDSINDFTFSPDGKRAATASDDHKACLWAIPSGERIGVPLPHDGDVTSVVFSRDGSRLLTTSRDGTARLWDGKTGVPVASPLPHADAVTGGAFAPSGGRFATWTENHVIRIWEEGSSEPTSSFTAHSGRIRGACFDANGEKLVTASADRTAKVWDCETSRDGEGSLLVAPVAHPDIVFSAALSPDGALLATVAGDRRTRVFELCRNVQPDVEGKRQPSTSPGGKYNYTEAFGETLRLERDADSSALVLTLPSQLASGDSGWEGNVVFAPDDSSVVTLHADHSASIWDLAKDGSVTAHLPSEGPDKVYQVVISPDSRHLALVRSRISVYDLRTGAAVCDSLEPEVAGVQIQRAERAAFSPDSRVIAGAGWNGLIQCWSLPSGKAISEPILAGGRGGGLAFSDDGQWLIAETTFGTLQIWNVLTGLTAANPIRLAQSSQAVAISGDIGARASDRDAHVWHLPTGRILAGPFDLKRRRPKQIRIADTTTALTLYCEGGHSLELLLDPLRLPLASVVLAEALAGQRIDAVSGVHVQGVQWDDLRKMRELVPERRPKLLSAMRSSIIGEWSFEHWVDAQLPPASAKVAFALAERFPEDPLVNAGLAAYFVGAEWPPEVAKKMRDLAPGHFMIASLSIDPHPLVSYWNAHYHAYSGDLPSALHAIRLALRKRPEDPRFRTLAEELRAFGSP